MTLVEHGPSVSPRGDEITRTAQLTRVHVGTYFAALA